MSKGEKSLWDLAIDVAENSENQEKAGEEKSILFVGSRDSGKTSIILRFLDRDEPPKPTTALEYTFGRRAKGHNLAKDVAHIWELGGGTWLSRLCDIPINYESVEHIAVAVVLDLSKPQSLWATLESLLKTTRGRIESAISEVAQDDPKVKERMKQAAWARVGEEHVDKDMMDPFPVPLVLIGGKYDIFQDFDPEKRKVICRTLRFVAHTYAAHVMFFSTKTENLISRTRGLVSHLVFGTAARSVYHRRSKTIQLEHNNPLIITAGTDSFQNIGSPPLSDGDIGRVSARTPVELWKLAYTGFFPQDAMTDPSLVDDPAKDAQYKESAIDSMRKQKDEDLERYRRLSERRMKEERQRAMAEGLA